MSESIDEREIGTGGGLGKYAALPLKEIRAIFEKCRQDPSMRSVKVVLRIVKEQVEARGSLGSYPQIGLFFLVLGFAAIPFQNAFPQARYVSMAALLIGMGLVASSWSLRHQRRAALFQEELIRREALESLRVIVASPSYVPGSLDWSQALTLRRLMAAERAHDPALKALLESAER